MAIERIYAHGEDGFEIPRDEERAVRAARSDPLYGELLPGSLSTLLRRLDLGPSDVFYDLGSGVGKVVVQAAIELPLARCVGVELSTTRLRIARGALREARRRGLVQARRTVLRQGDLMAESLADATVVYTCSTAFSARFMARLVRKLLDLDRELTFATLQDPEPRRGLEPIGEVDVATNWNESTPVYLYKVHAGFARLSRRGEMR